MRRFLGVDGGQSSTLALIGDETGRVVGIGRGPGCKNAGAVDAAVHAAGGGSFDAACFGLSGGTAGRETALRVVAPAEHYVFTHDAAIGLTGALAGEPGIIVIAGTGSMAFGRNAAGRTARAGGWGYLFGDEGGAFDLVRQALRAALREEEGWGPATVLRGALLGAAGAANADELMHRFYTDEWPRERIAALAMVVDQTAAADDVLAQEILKGAAQSLATVAGIVRSQLFAQEESVGVSYSGGVFRSPVVLARFRMLMELEDGNRLVAPRFGPAAGALIEAYRAAGIGCLPEDVPMEKT